MQIRTKEVDLGKVLLLFLSVGAGGLAFAVLWVKIYPALREKASAWLGQYHMGRQWLHNLHFRAGVTVAGSFLINVIYGVFEGTLAILSRSLWYASLSAYHLCLSVMRFRIILHKRQKAKCPNKPVSHGVGMYKSTGMILLFLSVLIFVTVAEMIVSGFHFAYAGVMLLGVSVYAAVKMTLNVRSFLKARQLRSHSLKAIRSIGIADALMSLFALQTALLSTLGYPVGEQDILNGITGGLVCVTVASLGIVMMREEGK